MMGKKILMVSDSFPPVPSGVSKYTYYLTKKLIEKGNTVYVITGGVKGEVKEEYLIRKTGGKVFRFGKLISVMANGTRCFITLMGPKDLVKMKKLFESFLPDAVIMQGPLGLTLPYPATLLSKSKNIGIFHSSTDKPNIAFILLRWFMKPFLKALDVKIAVSEKAKAEIENYFGKQDFYIIPPGVDTNSYNPSVSKKSEKEIVFFFLGRLDERKGVDVLLRAWRYTAKYGIKNGKMIPMKLVIGGDGPKRKFVEDECGKLENVKYIGFVPEENLPKLYASADVSVFPSKGGESFGIVLIESMACGTPPLASKIGGYTGVIKDGKAGLLFASESDLVEKINKISTDEKLRLSLSSECYKYAKNYDWDVISDKIEALI